MSGFLRKVANAASSSKPESTRESAAIEEELDVCKFCVAHSTHASVVLGQIPNPRLPFRKSVELSPF